MSLLIAWNRLDEIILNLLIGCDFNRAIINAGKAKETKVYLCSGNMFIRAPMNKAQILIDKG